MTEPNYRDIFHTFMARVDNGTATPPPPPYTPTRTAEPLTLGELIDELIEQLDHAGPDWRVTIGRQAVYTVEHVYDRTRGDRINLNMTPPLTGR